MPVIMRNAEIEIFRVSYKYQVSSLLPMNDNIKAAIKIKYHLHCRIKCENSLPLPSVVPVLHRELPLTFFLADLTLTLKLKGPSDR